MNLHPFHDTPGLLGEVSLPEMVLLCQHFPRPHAGDVEVVGSPIPFPLEADGALTAFARLVCD